MFVGTSSSLGVTSTSGVVPGRGSPGIGVTPSGVVPGRGALGIGVMPSGVVPGRGAPGVVSILLSGEKLSSEGISSVVSSVSSEEGVTAFAPEQRELSGKRTHKISIASGESSSSAAATMLSSDSETFDGPSRSGKFRLGNLVD